MIKENEIKKEKVSFLLFVFFFHVAHYIFQEEKNNKIKYLYLLS